MTQNNENGSRLDRIEAILLQNTSQISTLLESQVKIQQGFIELQGAQTKTQQQLDSLSHEVESLSRDMRASVEDMIETITPLILQTAENATFIKGLQVENRRILRELRDRRNGNP